MQIHESVVFSVWAVFIMLLIYLPIELLCLVQGRCAAVLLSNNQLALLQSSRVDNVDADADLNGLTQSARLDKSYTVSLSRLGLKEVTMFAPKLSIAQIASHLSLTRVSHLFTRFRNAESRIAMYILYSRHFVRFEFQKF